MVQQSVIDESPLSRFHIRLLVQSSGGPFLDGWLLTVIGLALIGMTPALHLSATEISLVGAAALIGIFFGGLIFGYLTDLIGRRVMYTVDLGVLVAASVLSAFVTSAWQIILLRFIIGLAIGADYPIATALLAEWLPRKWRGQMLGWLFVGWSLGACLAAFVGVILIAWQGNDAWRWLLGASAVPGLAILLLRIGTPESPRWLLSKGRASEADDTLRRATPSSSASPVSTRVPGTAAVTSRDLLKPVYVKRLLFSGIYYIATVTPYIAIYIFGPDILKSFGMAQGNKANLGYALISFVFLLANFPAIWLMGRVGRRKLSIVSFALAILPFAVLSAIAHPSAPVLIGAMAAYAFFIGAPSILVWVYPNELFPTEVRATANGIVTAISRIGQAAGVYLLPIALHHSGTQLTMLIAGIITAVGFLITVFMAPETKDQTLDEASSTDSSDSFLQTLREEVVADEVGEQA